MTVTIIYGDAADGYLHSYASLYQSARIGSGAISVDNSAAIVIYGQELSGGMYRVLQGFLRWTYTATAGEVLTGAAFRLYHSNITGNDVARNLEIHSYGWTSPLGAAAFRDPAAIQAAPLLATVQNVQSSSAKYSAAGSSALMSQLASGSQTLNTVLVSSRDVAGYPPTASEYSYIRSADEAGTTNDPALVLTSVARSTLFGVLGAAVRLSDGSWALLESDGGTAPVITLRRHTGTSVATVATIPIGTVAGTFAAPSGAQALALMVDASDSLYVVGAAGNASGSVAARKYTKGTGWTWTAGSVVTSALPAYSGPINQVVGAWHNTGGAGSLFIVAGHAPGTGLSGPGGNDVVHALLSASYLTVASSGATPGVLLPQPALRSGYYNAFTNETGSALDVAASSAGATAGYVVSPGKDSVPGDNRPLGVGRYEVSNSAIVNSWYRSASSSYARKDGSAKVRVVPTGPSSVAVVSADPDSAWGITVVPYGTNGSGWWALSQPITLDSQGISSMPAASALAGSLAWDAVYLARENKLWIYYPDATDGRIVRRTGVDLTTYQATREQVTVSTVGSAGGTNLAVRVPRNADAATGVLLTVAHKASGGALSTSYVLDAYNVDPTEPTIASRGNFDASQAAAFSWTFNDPNLPADGQTAYQLQIMRVSDSVVVVDTGKVTSTTSSRSVAGGTLSNGVAYQWRVRTYDQGDLVSPWSPYGAFSTAAGGTITITAPATDNPAGVVADELDVTWSVVGTTQAKYRAWVTRGDTGSTVFDTGLIASTQTTAHVRNMASDVENTIHVVVQDALNISSNEATRKITPSFATPEQPVATVTMEQDGGYVLVSVFNPAPGTVGTGFPLWDFEPGQDVSVFGLGASTLTASTEQAHSGTQSGKMVATGGAGTAYVRAPSAAVVAGVQYRMAVWVYVPVARNVQAQIDWRAAGDSYVSTSSGPVTAVAANTWTELTVTGTAPPTATGAGYGWTMHDSPAAGSVSYGDGMLLSVASDRPVPTLNRVWRRVAGSGEDYAMIGTTVPDGEFRDYDSASGVTYEYRVEAVA